MNSRNSMDGIDGAWITAVGIGSFGAKVTKLLSTNSSGVACYEVLADSVGNDTAEIMAHAATVQETRLLFLIYCFDDAYCEPLFDQFAEMARKAGVLTVAVIPTGDHWDFCSLDYLAERSKYIDTLCRISDAQLDLKINADQQADATGQLICQMIATISHMLTQPVMIDVFLDDVEAALKSGKAARVGVGEASNTDGGRAAALLAVKRLLDQQVCMESVTGAIVCLQGSNSMTLDDYEEMRRVVHEHLPEGINIVESLFVNETMGNYVNVIIMAMQN